MASQFSKLITELEGAIPHLPRIHAAQLVTRSWEEICDLRSWSFLVQYADIYAPLLIQAGAVTVLLGSNIVLADATAKAALNLVALSPNPVPPLSGEIGTCRQFRVGSSTASGPIYNISAYDSISGLITLDRPYTGDNATGQPYLVYKCYYSLPSTNFLKYDSIVNPFSGYGIIRDALNVPQQSLNIFDPQRCSFGDAYYLSPFRDTITGNIVHEFYPHPQTNTTYQALYRVFATPFDIATDLPATMPYYLVAHRSYMQACDWALQNVGNFPELAQTNWVLAKKSRQSDFESARIMAIKRDDAISPMLPVRCGRYYANFPMGGQWLQSHALPLGYSRT